MRECVTYVKHFFTETLPSHNTWWRHQMETFSALLAICAGNSPVPGEFPAQRPVTRSFDFFFDLRPDKRLSKQPWGWWFETSLWSLCRQCNKNVNLDHYLCFLQLLDRNKSWTNMNAYNLNMEASIGRLHTWNVSQHYITSHLTRCFLIVAHDACVYNLGHFSYRRIHSGWSVHRTLLVNDGPLIFASKRVFWCWTRVS